MYARYSEYYIRLKIDSCNRYHTEQSVHNATIVKSCAQYIALLSINIGIFKYISF